ncbi:hypothetical protein DFH06DRAFT_1083086 [Mycena polygramma]|nr:hypothetical protein DFH06DRAFT_1083086 [Mycena polygramma]
MSAYKSFAVIGAGTLGLPIINALVAKNVSVVLLSRPGSAPKEVPKSVEVVHVDYTNAAAVAEVFKQHKVEVVLPTITTTASATQKPFADAAKLAGVKLFVPSEYGCPTDGHTDDLLAPKNEIAEYLKSINIPSARIYVGNFIEFIPWITSFGETGKFTIVGKGDAQMSFTSIGDIAGFVAHILTTLPASELENRIFRIQGDRGSFHSVASQFKTTVEHVDTISGETGPIKTALLTLFDTGAASTGWDAANKVERTGSEAAGSSNALWEGHHWKTIKEVHNL